jgi:hypothetical protein
MFSDNEGFFIEKKTGAGGRKRIKPPMTGTKSIPRPPTKTGSNRKRRQYPR